MPVTAKYLDDAWDLLQNDALKFLSEFRIKSHVLGASGSMNAYLCVDYGDPDGTKKWLSFYTNVPNIAGNPSKQVRVFNVAVLPVNNLKNLVVLPPLPALTLPSGAGPTDPGVMITRSLTGCTFAYNRTSPHPTATHLQPPGFSDTDVSAGAILEEYIRVQGIRFQGSASDASLWGRLEAPAPQITSIVAVCAGGMWGFYYQTFTTNSDAIQRTGLMI
jgi:hypothetical protein